MFFDVVFHTGVIQLYSKSLFIAKEVIFTLIRSAAVFCVFSSLSVMSDNFSFPSDPDLCSMLEMYCQSLSAKGSTAQQQIEGGWINNSNDTVFCPDHQNVCAHCYYGRYTAICCSDKSNGHIMRSFHSIDSILIGYTAVLCHSPVRPFFFHHSGKERECVCV